MIPRSKKGRATRARILQAAQQLMLDRGVVATTVDEILKASGAGKSQFYHYFDSKDHLVEEIIQAAIAASPFANLSFTSSEEGIRSLDTWLQDIEAGFRSRHAAQGCPLANLIGQCSQGPEMDILAAAFQDWMQQLAGKIAELRLHGEIRPDVCPDETAGFIISGLEGALVVGKVQRGYNLLSGTVRQLRSYLRSLGDHDASVPRGKMHVGGRRRVNLSYCP